jgi:ribulose-5-phosphate 4-epimerase/fuculose-1-phosphate aldolase
VAEAGRPVADGALADLVAYAVRAGADLRLVQGAGGNFSMKSDGVVWVKASGTRLAEAATRPIFVPLDLEAARPAVLVTESLARHILTHVAPEGLRPSIETAFHVLLPHRFVAHLHPSGAIALGLDPRSGARLDEVCRGLTSLEVPYAKPGIELARRIHALLPEAIDPLTPLVVLLKNHGLVVAAATVAELEETIDLVRRRTEIAEPPEFLDAPAAGTLEGFDLLAPAGSLSATGSAVLDHGPLTPDAAVFLGARPFAPASESAESTACVVLPDGSVEISGSLGLDEREIAWSMVDVGRLVPDGVRARALDEAEIRELIEWDAEKWRRGMKR